MLIQKHLKIKKILNIIILLYYITKYIRLETWQQLDYNQQI